MFEAFSKSKNKVVNVENEYNLNEIFYCPDPQCGAKFKIKSPSGRKRKHFARLKSSQHYDDCLYDKDRDYYQKENLLFNKSPIEDIYASKSIFRSKNNRNNELVNSKQNQKVEVKNISTPLQLYKFCVQNSLDTIYQEDITVNDIVVDYRNLVNEKLYFGFDNLRLVIAKTYRYSLKDNCIQMYLKQGKYMLHLSVYLDTSVLNEVLKYIFDTYGTFSGHTIAILEYWKKTTAFHCSCTITNVKHIMYKFGK